MNLFSLDPKNQHIREFKTPVSREKLHLLLNNGLIQHIRENAESLTYNRKKNSEHGPHALKLRNWKWGQTEDVIIFSQDYINPLLGLLMILSGHCFDGTSRTHNGTTIRIKFVARLMQKDYSIEGYILLNPLKDQSFNLSRVESYPKPKHSGGEKDSPI